MDLREYPRWKETGIDWLSKLPEHWELNKFRFMFRLGRGLGITKSNLIDEGVPCVNYGEIHSKFGFEVAPEKHDLKCVPEHYLESSPNSLLEQGDFVYADTSEDIEGSGNFTHLNSSVPTFAGYHTVTAKPVTNNHSKFLAYLFHSELFRFQIRKSVSGVKVFSVTQDILKSCYVWLPPTVEQIQIAKFLDYKTAQIDCLIEKKKALIEKLNEQRIAMITQAVTKGLNPDAPMKDSEVDWLGEVPEHWEVARLRFSIRSNPIKSEINDIERDEIVSFVPMDAVGEYGGIRLDTNKILDDVYDGYTYFRDNDVVIAKITPCFENGKGALASNLTNKIAFGTTELHVMRPLNECSSRWLFYLSISHAFREIGASEMYGAGGQKRVPESFIKNFRLGIPSFEEQETIADYLDFELKKMSDMLAVNDKTIERLNEYRTALITAAVTGKIDVRNIEVPEEY